MVATGKTAISVAVDAGGVCVDPAECDVVVVDGTGIVGVRGHAVVDRDYDAVAVVRNGLDEGVKEGVGEDVAAAVGVNEDGLILGAGSGRTQISVS